LQASFRDNRQTVIKLFVLSVLALYLELLVIRWMSADIRAFSVFKTFPLATFFIGLGVGFNKGSDRLFKFCPLALLCFVAFMKLANLLHFETLIIPSTGTYNWLEISQSNFWVYTPPFMIGLLAVLYPPFAIASALGSYLGVLFDQLEPLPAYCTNIAGSLAGSIAFTLLSYLGLSPAVMLWPVVIVVAWLFGGKELISNFLRVTLPLALIVLLSFWTIAIKPSATTYWSPYQRLDFVPFQGPVKAFNPANKNIATVSGFQLLANGMPYQAAMNLTPTIVKDFDIPLRLLEFQRHWALPFQLIPPDDVLIVGSGTGSDASQALAYGSKSIDAVDIDPVIISIGKKLHPLRPYDDPRVHVICDDARHFFNHCQKKYDVVVFAFLDSHTVAGVSSAVRLDNFIYTKESFAKARQLLKPNGIMLISFVNSAPWFSNRLYWTLTDALGYKPLAYTDKHDLIAPCILMVAGEGVKQGAFTLPASVTNYFLPLAPSAHPERVLTDDWPYLYLSPVKVDFVYLLVVAEIVLLAALFSSGLFRKKVNARCGQFFFLGAAFMLLELQFISRLSLIYGATWLTSGTVINGVLFMILLANLGVIKYKDRFLDKQPVFYAMLFLSLLASYILPVSELSQQSIGFVSAGNYLVTVITLLPVLFAAVIFALAFSAVEDPAHCLAFNLFGAVLGALLEYLSNYIGTNNLLLVAIVLYLLSYFFLRAEARHERAA
jgi:hypothetical protein